MIFGSFSNVRIFLKTGPTDMRKQINGLAAMAKDSLTQDPFSGSLFVFCNRKRDLTKVIYWDRNGFCMWLKRLERDRFPWPESSEEAQEITTQQLQWLLNGIDFRKEHRTLKYSHLV